MKKTLTAVLAVATIAVSVATFATEASAGRRGGAVAAGRRRRHHRRCHRRQRDRQFTAGLCGQPAPVYVAPPRYCIVDQQVWSNRHQAWVVRPTRVPC